ncbi:MAG TPA: hypothetical protein VFD27_01200 [Chthoniobacteraceae bacterium]|nr:hypothetical protein [Chthoniobacteraceae bacterium]
MSGHVAAMSEGEILDRADKVSTLTKSGMTVFGLERTNAPVNVLVQVGLLGIEPPIAYAAGIALREIARKLGIPAGTVLARAKREGWTRQVRDAKALVARQPYS